jgi:hypothetical protein
LLLVLGLLLILRDANIGNLISIFQA